MPVAMMPVVPVMVMPMMPMMMVPVVVPADLFGLEAIDLVLRNDRGLLRQLFLPSSAPSLDFATSAAKARQAASKTAAAPNHFFLKSPFSCRHRLSCSRRERNGFNSRERELLFVIPGRAKREPGIHNHCGDYGFRVCAKRRIPE